MVQKEASLETKEELTSLLNEDKTEIRLSTGKTVRIGYLKGITQDKIDDIIIKYESFKKTLGDTDKDTNKGNKYTRRFYAQCAAAILLNSYWGIKLFWWLKWRLLYNFGGWSGSDYLTVITESKKKAQEQEYSLGMVFLMDMTTTWTTMTQKEAAEYRHELQLAREAQSLRSSRD